MCICLPCQPEESSLGCCSQLIKWSDTTFFGSAPWTIHILFMLYASTHRAMHLADERSLTQVPTYTCQNYKKLYSLHWSDDVFVIFEAWYMLLYELKYVVQFNCSDLNNKWSNSWENIAFKWPLSSEKLMESYFTVLGQVLVLRCLILLTECLCDGTHRRWNLFVDLHTLSCNVHLDTSWSVHGTWHTQPFTAYAPLKYEAPGLLNS